MSATAHKWSLRLVLLAALAAAGCVMQVVDLRSEAKGDPPAPCAPSERLDPDTGTCATCFTMPLPPGNCPCVAVVPKPMPFPYCDTPDAYYDCGECKGSIFACADFTPDAGDLGRLGLTHDCARMADCCAQLALATPPVACCPCGSTLTCELDTGAPESGQFIVSCDPPPTCDPPCSSDPASPELCCTECGCQCIPGAP